MATEHIRHPITFKLDVDPGWFFALIALGYPIIALLGIIADMDGRTVSWGFRISMAALAAVAWVTRFGRVKRADFPVWILLFLTLYVLRLIADTTSDLWDAPTALGYFAAFVLAPVAGMIPLAASWNDIKAAKLFFYFGWAASALAIAAQSFHLTDRSTFAMNGRLSFDVVDPITIGVVGVVTVLAGIARLERPGAFPWRLPVILAGIATGFAALIQSASRGPLISLAVAVLFYLIMKRRWLWIAALGVACAFYVTTQPMGDILQQLRFGDIGQDQSALHRLVLQQSAIAEFVAHPILGSFYTEINTGEYPHNLIVDSAMSLGVVGLTLFVSLMATGVYFGGRSVRRGSIIAPLLFIQALIESQFSGGLGTTYEIWIPLIVIFRAWNGPTAQARWASSSKNIARRTTRFAAGMSGSTNLQNSRRE
jgi:hypothetical protein